MQHDERRRIRNAFDAAAPAYDGGARIQREIANALAEWAGPTLNAEGLALDAGCGTGGLRARFASAHSRAKVLGIDLAPGMAAIARQHYASALCADLEALPLKNASIELYWSSLAWQWCDPRRAADEAARVLGPNGVALIATLGPQTFAELRTSFATLDAAEHIRHFDPPELLRSALTTAGFSSVSMIRQTHIDYADTLHALLRSIRAIGAHTLGDGRRRGLLGKNAWRRLCEDYASYRSEAGLPARYDVILIEARR